MSEHDVPAAPDSGDDPGQVLVEAIAELREACNFIRVEVGHAPTVRHLAERIADFEDRLRAALSGGDTPACTCSPTAPCRGCDHRRPDYCRACGDDAPDAPCRAASPDPEKGQPR